MKFKSVLIILFSLLLLSIFNFMNYPYVQEDKYISKLNVSSVQYTNATLLSDGYKGIYWNDDYSFYSDIAVDSKGNIHVVWYDNTDGPWGTDTEIMYVKYTQDMGWLNITVISDGFGGIYWNDGTSRDPEIAVDKNDNLHVVWEDNTYHPWDFDYEIMYVNYTQDTGWSNATVISDGFEGIFWNDDSSYNPHIALDGDNNVHVVWYDHTEGSWGGYGIDYEIMYVEYTQDIGWSNVTVISDGFQGVYWNTGFSLDPKVAAEPNGNIHVVWEDNTAGIWRTEPVDYEIMYVKFTQGVGWSNVTVISDGFGGIYWNNDESSDPSIVVDGKGNIHVVWYDNTDGPWGTDTEIMYVKYTQDIGWSNVTIISDGFEGVYWNNDGSFFPDIAIDSKNNIHVVWYDDTNGPWGIGADYEVMYVNYITGKGWSNITVISDGFQGVYWNDGTSYRPQIAIGSNKIHVIWDDNTAGPWGSDYEIWYTSVSLPAISKKGAIIPFGSFYLFTLLIAIVGLRIFIKRKLKSR